MKGIFYLPLPPPLHLPPSTPLSLSLPLSLSSLPLFSFLPPFSPPPPPPFPPPLSPLSPSLPLPLPLPEVAPIRVTITTNLHSCPDEWAGRGYQQGATWSDTAPPLSEHVKGMLTPGMNIHAEQYMSTEKEMEQKR